MCEDNDAIMEGLAEAIIDKSPNISHLDLKIAVDKAFENLPEPDTKAQLEEEGEQ